MQCLPIAAISSDRAGLVVGGIVVAWLLACGLVAWRRTAGLAATALLGLGVSLYLGRQHHPSAGESFCSVSSTFDCDAVNRSAWSEVGGVPIAFFGAAFYGAVLLAGALGLFRPAGHERAPHLVFGGSVLAVAYSAVLAWVSFRMGAWCLFCISLYGFNLVLLAGSLLEVRSSGVPLGEGLRQGFRGEGDRTLWVMIVAGAVAFVGGMAWYRTLGGPAAPALELTELFSDTPAPLDLRGNEPALGKADAPYTVVEFADFQCPSCADAVPDALALVEREPGVRLLFKHYPISGLCNDQVEGARHDKACGAAAAAECARAQGKFWELEKLMFKNQDFLAPEDIAFMARQTGLDVDALQACASDPATLAVIKSDVAAARGVGLEYTPSFYLRGIRGDGWVQVRGGPPEAALLIAAHKAGQKF